MAAGDTDIGTGATITFGTSLYTGELLSVDWSGISRPSVKLTHMADTEDQFTPGDIVDYGEIRISWWFKADVEPPIKLVPEVISIVLPDTTTWSATAFMTDFEWGCPMEEGMTMDGTLKVTGDLTTP